MRYRIASSITSARPENTPTSRYTHRWSSWRVFRPTVTTSVRSTPASATRNRPGSTRISGGRTGPRRRSRAAVIVAPYAAVRWDVLDVRAGQPAPEVHQAELDPVGAKLRPEVGDEGEGPVPRGRVELLGADVERHARREARGRGPSQQVDREVGGAPELAGERPGRTEPVAEDPAERRGTGRRLDELVELGLGVEREAADPQAVRLRDVALLLDGVAEAELVGRRSGSEALVDLADGRHVEARTLVHQQLQHVGVRVRLHGVEDRRDRQGGGQLLVALGDDVEVEHQQR